MFPFEIAQPESPQNDIHHGQAKDSKHPQHDFQSQTDAFALACGIGDNLKQQQSDCQKPPYPFRSIHFWLSFLIPWQYLFMYQFRVIHASHRNPARPALF